MSLLMVRLIGAFLLAGGWLHPQAVAEPAPNPAALFSLTPMIGTSLDIAPYGIEAVYASFALSASYGESPVVSLWTVVLASREAVYFRVPLIFSIHFDRFPSLGLLFGCGPGSWSHGGSTTVFPLGYAGMTWSWRGWSFTAVVSEVVGSDFSDLLLDLYVGRVLRL